MSFNTVSDPITDPVLAQRPQSTFVEVAGQLWAMPSSSPGPVYLPQQSILHEHQTDTLF